MGRTSLTDVAGAYCNPVSGIVSASVCKIQRYALFALLAGPTAFYCSAGNGVRLLVSMPRVALVKIALHDFAIVIAIA